MLISILLLKVIRIIGFAPEASARIGASAEVLVWTALEEIPIICLTPLGTDDMKRP
jgi:hypothetical protein